MNGVIDFALQNGCTLEGATLLRDDYEGSFIPFGEYDVPSDFFEWLLTLGMIVVGDGFIRYVDHMGSDDSVVQAARVSYGKGTKTIREDRKLIEYLMKNRHTTPFEMVEFKFHIRVAMDTWRQWIRHRTASVNEYSTRYSVAIDSCERAGVWRMQSDKNKQGSAGTVDSWPDGWILKPGKQMLSDTESKDVYDLVDQHGYTLARFPYAIDPQGYLTLRETILLNLSREVYEERLKFNVAREQARKDLPLSNHTEAYWKIDLHNLFHFLRLRLDSHAQKEIRDYAEAILRLINPFVPMCCEAFEEYGRR